MISVFTQPGSEADITETLGGGLILSRAVIRTLIYEWRRLKIADILLTALIRLAGQNKNIDQPYVN